MVKQIQWPLIILEKENGWPTKTNLVNKKIGLKNQIKLNKSHKIFQIKIILRQQTIRSI